MARYLALDKVKRFYDTVKHNGGIINSLKTLYRTDTLKMGTLIGTDKFGNKYYENKRYFYARDRWVDYNPERGLDYDGSQVPPEWHCWLHHITDTPPSASNQVQYKWLMDHTENFSGSSKAYTPYSTTQPKIKAWVPPK